MFSIEKMNEVKNSINLGEFYDKEYCDYAIYRAIQRIPSLIDGFAQTQRKVVYTMIDKNMMKKTKVSDLKSIVSLHTKYHHGDLSIESAITNLVPIYKNQVPLLKEDGTYGTRSEREASASRYIESRLYKYSKLLFNDIDNSLFVSEQYVEGQKIEPEFMIPILPLLLINGQSQIAVGFASDILPRKLETVIKTFKNILSGKPFNVNEINKPFFPLFNGDIEPNATGGWTLTGKITDLGNGKLHITEVPPKYTRMAYIKILNTLKENNVIKSYSENIVGDTFDITVRLSDKNDQKLLCETCKSNLLKVFKLQENVSENLTVIDSQGKIKKFENIVEMIQEYAHFMISIYTKRKEYLINKLKNDSLENNEKIRFIHMINADQIIIRNRKQSDIFKDLEYHNFIKIDNKYDYLLNMRISTLTLERVIELEKIIEEDRKKMEELENTSPALLWLNDINEFMKAYKKGE